MVNAVITNLNEEELYNAYLEMLDTCEGCKIIHLSCGVHHWDCSKCEYYHVVKGLRKYFDGK